MEYFQIISLCLATIINVFQCTKADSDKETILSLLYNTAGLQRFSSWTQDIDGLSNESSAFTVFAFNDAGYEASPSEEREALDQLDSQGRNEYVKDFIVNRLHDISQLHDGLELSSISGKHLYVNKKNYTEERPQGIVTTYVDGVPITGEGQQTSNGIIHILERPPGPIGDMTILDFIQIPNKVSNSTLFPEIIARLMRDYFIDAIFPLEQEGPITFFVPSSAAVEKISQNLASVSDDKLSRIFKMNFIPGHAIFTEPVGNAQSFQSKNLREMVTFHKDKTDVYVSGGGVTARLTTGNIRVDNGVIHVTDKMLGFIYQTALEHIQEDARIFGQLITNASIGTIELVTSPTGVDMFVPLDSAFDGLDVEKWNQTFIDLVVKLCIIRDAGSLSVSQISGDGYEKRLRRTSHFNNSTLVIYKDKNEMWVNGGNIRARIVRPDLEVTNGQLQYIDRVLGLPTMDIPELIYENGELLKPYSELKRLRLLNYLADPSYNRSKGHSHIDDPRLDPVTDTDSSLHTNESFWCDESCSSNSTDDAARCQFTVFLPSSKAFENFYNTTDGANITQDLCRYRHILRRHIIPHKVVSLEKMTVSANGQSYIADNGDEIKVRKESANDVRVIWGQTSARAILWDLGTTNGIIHIIDTILTDTDDLAVDIGPATPTLNSTTTTSTQVSTTTLPPSTSITTPVTTVKTTVAVSEADATVPIAKLIYFLLFSFFVC